MSEVETASMVRTNLTLSIARVAHLAERAG
ncbi:protein of unknown function [Nitrospira defluvii]|uniref:Uncharacterized protein n=1 Tax=Nitrospira defluvii TaxID=330214 RepID=D8PIH7_9BACT|nr:protein of unknown function [Nitrospira defluvii]